MFFSCFSLLRYGRSNRPCFYIFKGGGLSANGRGDGSKVFVDISSQREGQVHLRHSASAQQTAHCRHSIPESRSGKATSLLFRFDFMMKHSLQILYPKPMHVFNVLRVLNNFHENISVLKTLYKCVYLHQRLSMVHSKRMDVLKDMDMVFSAFPILPCAVQTRRAKNSHCGQ